MKDGVIADFFVNRKMLQHFGKQVHSNSFMRLEARAYWYACRSARRQVERRAIRESAQGAGAVKSFECEGRCDRLGRAVSTGSMVVDIGGDAAGSCVISLNGVVLLFFCPVLRW